MLHGGHTCISMHGHKGVLWPYLSFYVLCSWVCGSFFYNEKERRGGEKERDEGTPALSADCVHPVMRDKDVVQLN